MSLLLVLVGLDVELALRLVLHFDLGHLPQLAVDAERVDASLQLRVELHLQLLLRLLDLLLHEVRSLGLELRLDLLADLLPLLFLLQRSLVLLLDHA